MTKKIVPETLRGSHGEPIDMQSVEINEAQTRVALPEKDGRQWIYELDGPFPEQWYELRKCD